MKSIAVSLLAAAVAASPTNTPRQLGSGIWKEVWSLVKPYIEGVDLSIKGPFAPITPEILKSYLEPINVSCTINFFFIANGRT